MEYIKKEDITKRLNALIESRKKKTCSRQALVEMQCFKYVLDIIESLEKHEAD